MEGYYELVIDRLTAAGYRWYETANFCLTPELAGERPEREVELLDERVRGQERVMLGLRLDTGLPVAAASGVVDESVLERFERVGLACRRPATDGHERLVLTSRGRRLGGAVTADLLV